MRHRALPVHVHPKPRHGPWQGLGPPPVPTTVMGAVGAAVPTCFVVIIMPQVDPLDVRDDNGEI
jgi:hypothetical protein